MGHPPAPREVAFRSLRLLLIGALFASVARPVQGLNVAAPDSAQASPDTNGRVIATVTTLEGAVRMPGVVVELHAADGLAIAKTVTDGSGQVVLPDVPPGRYVMKATRAGFPATDSLPFEVRAGEATTVLLDLRVTFIAPTIQVRASGAAPTDSIQSVSMSDMLAGSVLDIGPLEGDDFQNLLPLLPGVLRGPDGRLRIKGGQPTQGGLQVSSASLVDPSSGDFDLDLPGQSLESVEVLANPFAAEYGRFSTTVTQIRTRRGTNDWEVKPGNLLPRFRRGFSSVRGFEPRFSVRGPLLRDRVFLAEDVQFRYVATPVRSLPGEPEIALKSFDSFTRIDTMLSARHTLGGGLILFPRQVERPTMTTFRPAETTPDFNQGGAATGLIDRFALAPNAVLETTLAGRWFEINVNTDGRAPMTYAPDTQSGSFFNDQEREVRSFQLVEALSVSRDRWHGEHVFKFGMDLQYSDYTGDSTSHPVEIRRLDGSLAERTVFGASTRQDVSGTDLGLFAQDRWRVGSRLTLELGLRLDRDAVVERLNWSPRAGLALSVLPEGRGILRGGFGKFAADTPLNIGAFASLEPRAMMRFGVDGSPLGPAVSLRNVTGELRTPEGLVGNVEWDQRFGRRLLLKVEYLQRRGSHEYILDPNLETGEVRLSSDGRSRYWEFEATGRYLGGERRDVTVSYVRSRGTADLNPYDLFYGNFRQPILRANDYNLTATDVPNRVLVRGTLGLPGKWDVAPVLEIRSGFPWSAIDEFQDFVGARNRAGRLPLVQTLDFQVARPWRFKKYRFRAGIKVYNLFGASAARDVQNNVASPDYGRFYNPLERSIGFVVGSAK